jgi:hypothetical protein
VVDVELTGAVEVTVVIGAVPTVAGQNTVRALLRSGNRIGLEDLAASVAAVVELAGIPVLELVACVAGPLSSWTGSTWRASRTRTVTVSPGAA